MTAASRCSARRRASSGTPLKGKGTEVWHPRFTYYGFRYVQVEGAVRDPAKATGKNATPVVLGVEGQFVSSSARVVGSFACSNPLFNKIHEIINWAIRSNMQSVLTDCPHREKLGWLEEAHLMGPSITYNYDVPALYTKIFQDMAEAAGEEYYLGGVDEAIAIHMRLCSLHLARALDL